MRQKSRFARLDGNNKAFARRFACVLCGVASALTAATASAQVGVFDEGMPAGVLEPRPGLNLGRFNFHGGVQGNVSYDDLVQIDADGRPDDDVTWTVSPFASVETEGPNARTLRLYYRPGFRFFTEHSDLNTVDHAALFDLRWPLNRLSLSLAQDVSVSSVVVRDIGNRARQMRFGTIGSADYELSDRTSLQLNLTYDRHGYEGEVTSAQNLIESQQWGQQLWGDYHWTSKISTGVGVAVTQLEVDNAPSQMSEGPEVRVNYNPTQDLSLRASVGVQFRQYDSGRSDTMEPVLRLNSSYQVRPGTVLGLEGHRTEMASGLHAGQNFVETGFMATLSQVFLERFSGSLGLGYNIADYRAAEEGVDANRSDSYYFIRSSVDWNMTDAWRSGIFFEHTGNESDRGEFDYDHNIVGLRASWSF